MPSRAVRARRSIAALVVVAGVGAVGCSSEPVTGGDDVNGPATTMAPDFSATLGDDGPPQAGGTLRLGIPSPIDEWNPISSTGGVAPTLARSAVYEPLLRVGADRTPSPYLADSIVSDTEGLEWTITLRPGVTFHDGTPLTAAGVKTNLEARMDAPLTAAALEPVGMVNVVDDTTVEVLMERPWFGFAAAMTGPAGVQVSPAALTDAEGESLPATGEPAGTGPFQIDGPSTLVRYDGYWGGAAPLEGIELVVVSDAKARADALAAGDVDLMLASDASGATRFLGVEGFRQVEDRLSTESVIELNTSVPPLDRAGVRRALAGAVDAPELARTVTRSVTTPAAGPWAEGEPWFVPSEPDSTAGGDRSDTDLGLELTLAVEPTVEEVQLAQAVADQWEAIGVEVDLVTRTPAELAVDRLQGRYEAALVHDYGLADPELLVPRWWGSGDLDRDVISPNTPRISDEDLDLALADLRSAPDPPSRTVAASDVLTAADQTAPVVWLVHDTWVLAGTDDVGGLGAFEPLGFARIDATPPWSQLWLRQ